jgi:hypothetical protein
MLPPPAAPPDNQSFEQVGKTEIGWKTGPLSGS